MYTLDFNATPDDSTYQALTKLDFSEKSFNDMESNFNKIVADKKVGIFIFYTRVRNFTII